MTIVQEMTEYERPSNVWSYRIKWSGSPVLSQYPGGKYKVFLTMKI